MTLDTMRLHREMGKQWFRHGAELKREKDPGQVTTEDEKKAKDGQKPDEKPTLPLRNGGPVDVRRATGQLSRLRRLLDKDLPHFEALLALAQGRAEKVSCENFRVLRSNGFVQKDGSIELITKAILDAAYMRVADGHFLREDDRLFADSANLGR